MSDIEVAVCEVCCEDIPEIIIEKDEADWFTKVYHKKCYDKK
jgi:hypothetical protein